MAATGYDEILADIVATLNDARSAAARSVNAVMTATYWQIGHRIVEHEQRGHDRAEYGQALLRRLAADLTKRFGRGFGMQNLYQMRQFRLAWTPEQIFQTASGKSDHRALEAAPGQSVAEAPARPESGSTWTAAEIAEQPGARLGQSGRMRRYWVHDPSIDCARCSRCG